MQHTKSPTQLDQNANQLVALFGALGDATRYKLLTLLGRNQEICVSELAEQVGISSAGASQQLKVLEKAGLIKRVRFGQKICYELDRSTTTNRHVLDIIENS